MDTKAILYMLASVICVLGSVMVVVYRAGKAWLEERSVSTDWYQRVSLEDLRNFAKKSPNCIIAYSVRFFGKTYYIPLMGTLTVENHVRNSKKNRYGWQRFTHPAFWKGELIVRYEGYLESQGYLLKKGTLAESA